jgi:peptidoglycan DL-endopeptidase CwlO
MAGTSWDRRAAVVFVAVAAVLTAVPGGSSAAPGDPSSIGEGGGTIAEALDAAARGYLDAQIAIDASKARQAELGRQLESTENRLASLTAGVNEMAAAAYRSRSFGTTSALLHSSSPGSFLERAVMINTITAYDDRQLRELTGLRAQHRAAKASIDAELAKQQEQLAVMAKKKRDAENALAAVGGRATGGFVSATSPAAKPAPRNPDGSWPPEKCIIDDPTTSGCITARTLNALQQAKAAGFTRFVSCFRTGDVYEHPKGRACDFAAQQNGFGGEAIGGDRIYGNNLAAYFVRNANALGVLYVIWFRQIWMPGTGWRSYSGGGDPSSAHTNHVHVSLY